MKRASLRGADVRVRSVEIEMGADGAPPSEFRIWRSGPNTTAVGEVDVFSPKSARSVMSHYERHGADVMLDLEHLSLDPEARNYDPDARGWCKLEVRGGELWAVDVRWTPDGERRLRERTQRYISPAFRRDKRTGEVLEVINLALTALPATDQLEPLVAASINRRTAMDEGEKDTGATPDLGAIAKAAEAAAEACSALAKAASGGKADEVMAAAKAADEAWDACEELAKPFIGPDPDDEKPAAEDAEASTPAAGGDKGGEEPPAGGTVKKKTVTTEYANSIADGLARELAELRGRLNKSDVRDIIQANRSKFTPALERWALTQSPEALRAFVAAAPERSAPAKEPQKKVEEKPIELTAEERRACRVTGADPEKLLAHKRALAAQHKAANAADEEG